MLQFKSVFEKSIKFIRQASLNRNIFNYLVCVVIASILWFLNTLNQDYTTEVNYPIKYINFPADKYPCSKLPSHLRLTIQAKGFTLIGYNIKTSFLPVTFDFDRYSESLQEHDGIYEFTLKTNDIKEKLGNQISPDIKLINVSPEKVHFKFAKATHKKVAIIPSLDYTLKRQYILNQVRVTPDSVLVSGPANVMDTLHYVRTATWKAKNINKTTQKSLELEEVGNCHLYIQKTDVTLEVEQFTEGRKQIAITPLHVPDSLNIRLFPNVVTVKYDVGLSKYKNISEKDFTFTVEYPKKSDVSYLAIQIARKPEFIQNLNITPQKVEYILEKK